jgi:S-methylmethionine-dependent homocysteine/selenocysteine methylase
MIVLDGGIGHALKLGGAVSTIAPETKEYFMAGALANLENPQLVTDIHREFIEAGCDVITANSYVVTPYNLHKFGLDKKTHELGISGTDLIDALVNAAISNAERAIALHKAVRIAVPLPPLSESYQTSNVPSNNALLDSYSRIARIAAPRCEIFLAETLSTSAEAVAALTAAQSHSKETWCAFTLLDDTTARLRDGTRLSSAIAHLATVKLTPDAILANCCHPASVLSAIPVILSSAPSGCLAGGYANGFETTTSAWLGQDFATFTPAIGSEFGADGLITPVSYAAWSELWVEAGASVVGGCCGILPDHVRCLVDRRKRIP